MSVAIFEKTPIAASALALGLATLGNLFTTTSPGARIACGVLSAVVALLVVVRLLVDVTGVREEFRNPAALAVFPAFSMALMQLATYLRPLTATAAMLLWVVGVVVQLGVTALFTARFVFRFKLAQVSPAWFLVFVGYVVASVTGPAFGAIALGRVLLVAGAIGYVVMLPVIAYRLLALDALPEPLLPTLAIFAAPPSLLLVGYLAVAPSVTSASVYLLLAVSTASIVFVITQLPGILRLRLYPSLAALTFPVAVTAAAFKQSAGFLAASGSPSQIVAGAATALAASAIALVAYVAVRYAGLYARPAPDPTAASVPSEA